MFNCKNCQYSALGNVDPNNIGATPPRECRRYPPQLVALPVQTVRGNVFAPVAAFPVVDDNAHCGEFQAATA